MAHVVSITPFRGSIATGEFDSIALRNCRIHQTSPAAPAKQAFKSTVTQMSSCRTQRTTA
eukprot:354212-Chlamydomonas_euryale.AAC.13